MRYRPLLLGLLLAATALPLPGGPLSGPAEANAGPAPIPQVLMEELQEDLEISEVQAAAILGNLAQETGNFTLLQQINGTAFGYSQWLGPRKRAFLAYARENGGKHSVEANYGFLLHEIETQYPEMMGRIRSAETLEEASRIFMREFLRPSKAHANLPARLRYAEAYLSGAFDGAGCAGPEHVEGNRILPCPEPVEASATGAKPALRFADLFPRLGREN
jgi:hypothetical protein